MPPWEISGLNTSIQQCGEKTETNVFQMFNTTKVLVRKGRVGERNVPFLFVLLRNPAETAA